MRIWPNEGEWGRVEDLGQVTPTHDPTTPDDYFVDHCGGLTFAGDGMLYYVASRWEGDYPREREVFATGQDPENTRRAEGAVWRLDPETLEREVVAALERPDACAHYVSRGAMDSHGDLFFGHVGRPIPVGFFRVALPDDRRANAAEMPLRMWG
jgi:hypothetical protein